MSKEVICPRCGFAVAIDPPGASNVAAQSGAAATIEMTLPATSTDYHTPFAAASLVQDATPRHDDDLGVFVAGNSRRVEDTHQSNGSTGSNDGLLMLGEPDPLLGEFVPPSHDPDATAEQPTLPAPDPILPEPAPESSPEPEPVPGPEPESFGGLLNLDPVISAPPRAVDPIEETEDDGDDEPSGISIGTLLLASYASAVTLALIYMIWTHRDRGPSGPETIGADSRPDLGAEGSRTLKPASPLASDHIASIGRALRVGGLEITPVEILDRPVRLVRAGSGGQSRNEPGLALHLRLRIKNLSTAPLSPIDASLVRAPDRGLPETFVETGASDRIDPYPLALASEWAIVGQPFEPVDPGETTDVLIVGESGSHARLSGPSLWRIRLRIAADRVETVGVRFEAKDVK